MSDEVNGDSSVPCLHEWKYGEDVCAKCGKKGGLEAVDDSRVVWVPVLGEIGDGEHAASAPTPFCVLCQHEIGGSAIEIGIALPDEEDPDLITDVSLSIPLHRMCFDRARQQLAHYRILNK
jgi:hypothetical protein